MGIDFKLIGKRVREVRIQSKLTQAELAEKMNLSAQYISSVETGNKKLSLQSLLILVNELGVTDDELLYGNQIYNFIEYEMDIHILMSDCSSNERRKLYEILRFHKELMRDSL